MVNDMVVVIKDWFVGKIDLGYGKSLASNVGTVVKETEKAYLLVVEWYSVDGEYDGFQDVWCPKSCTMTEEEYEAEQKEKEERFIAGVEAYEKLVAWAKENGVKGVRKGLRKQTILNKITEAGLVYPA